MVYVVWRGRESSGQSTSDSAGVMHSSAKYTSTVCRSIGLPFFWLLMAWQLQQLESCLGRPSAWVKKHASAFAFLHGWDVSAEQRVRVWECS